MKMELSLLMAGIATGEFERVCRCTV